MADQTIGDRFRRAVAGAAGRIAARSSRPEEARKADPGTPVESVVAAAEETPAKKTPAKKAPAKKAPAKKAPAKKAPAKKAPAKKAPDEGTTHSSEGALPVRPGEDPWTPAEIEEVRGELREDLDRLNTELIAMDAGLAELLSEGMATAGDDQADTGSKSFEREHEMALAGNVRDMRDQVQRALDRLAAGSFGICQSCGQPIGKLRLGAFPRATLCLECKRQQERR